MTNQYCNWPECENVLAKEIWELYEQIRSLKYKLDRISGSADVPEWVRDYAGGRAKWLNGADTKG